MFQTKYNVIFVFLLFCFPFVVEAKSENVQKTKEKNIVIIVASYKNAQWYRYNLHSLLSQRYSNYRIIYTDDNSPDGTAQYIENYLKKRLIEYQCVDFDDSSFSTPEETGEAISKLINKKKHFFTLIRNVNRCGALANLYRMIRSCADKDIICTVDGDDWLYNLDVLKGLNQVYSERDILYTHGTLVEYPHNIVAWSEPIPKKVIEKRSFRKYKCPSHLRTFYCWLFKKIKTEDFLYNGQFFPMAWDMAIMFPIAEMSGKRHAFFDNVTYVYNMANQINDNKVNPKLQNELDAYIRNMPPYPELD